MAHPKGMYIRFPFKQQIRLSALDFDYKIPFPYLPPFTFKLYLFFVVDVVFVEHTT